MIKHTIKKMLLIMLMLCLMVTSRVGFAEELLNSQINYFDASALAKPVNQTKNFSSYIAIMLGQQNLSLDQKTSWSNGSSGVEKYPGGTDGLTGNIALGIKWNFAQCFGLGAEVFYTPTEITLKENSSSDDKSRTMDQYSITQKLNNVWGVQVLPGYYLSQKTFFYVPIGWVKGKLRVESDRDYNQLSNFTLNGIRYGLGLEHELNRNLHLRFEYLVTQYQKFHQIYSSSDFNQDISYRLRTNQFNVGLAYYFDDIKPKFKKETIKLKNGWYAGLGLGQSTQVSQLTINNGYDNLHQTQSVNASNVVGNAAVGYDYTFENQIYLGVEANSFLGSNNAKNTIDATNSSMSRKSQVQNSIQFSILPGYQLSDDFRVYARLGVAKGQYHYAIQSDDIQHAQHKTINGIVMGVGAEMAVSQQMSLRAEYQQARYQSVKNTFYYIAETVKPVMHYYTISMLYHFG